MTHSVRIIFVLVAMCSHLAPAFAQYYWGPPDILNSDFAVESSPDGSPQIATDGAGTWLAIWHSTRPLNSGDTDIFFSRSTDNGETWSLIQPLHSDFETDTPHDYASSIATDGAGNWIVVWHTQDPQDVSNRDIFHARSTDGGATWNTPAPLHVNDPTEADGFPEIVYGGSGEWIVVWESQDTLGGTIGTDWDILAIRSIDNGATWSVPQPVNDDATTDTDADILPDLATDGNGNWMVLWEYEVTIVLHRLQVASSSDGTTWNPTVAPPSLPEAETGSHPALASDGAGGWMAAWVSADSPTGYRNVFTTRSTDFGVTWAAAVPVNPHPGPMEEVQYADVMSFGSGAWVVTWTGRNSQVGQYGGDDDALISVSIDGGETWTALLPINNDAATDVASEGVPRVATDLAGTWIAVWESHDQLTDADIRLARGVVPVPATTPAGWVVLCTGLLIIVIWRGARRRA